MIPNAVDAAAFPFGVHADPGLRRTLGLDGATVIGFAGSFYRYEGLHLLLEAALQLIPRYPRLKVLLVGGGPQETSLKAQVAACDLRDRVIFTGRIAQLEVQRYYALIDLLAYPRISNRLTELVTPLKPLEAMAQGRMFVASDVGGHRELVRQGETGHLFAPGDPQAMACAMDDLLSHQERWPSIRLQARKFVETERSWATSVARYREVYQMALRRYPHTQAIQI